MTNGGMNIADPWTLGRKMLHFNPSGIQGLNFSFTFWDNYNNIGVCGWRSSAGRAADL